MAILNADLDRIQIGMEATAGTLIAATRLVPFVDGSYEAMVDRKEIQERRGRRASYDDVVTGRGSTLELSQELDFEHLLAALQCGFADVDPTTANMISTYTFTPGVLAPVALKTATVEVVTNDGGSTNRNKRFGFARPTSIGIEVSDGTAMLSTTWEGRAGKPLASPAAVSSFARTIIPVRAFKVYIDDSWASLGTTMLGSLRTLSVDYDPGLEAAYNEQGRADLDMTHWRRHRFEADLTLTVDHDDDSDSEIDHYEAGDLRFIRIEAELGTKRLRMDHCIRYLTAPDYLQADGDQHTLDLEGSLRSDGASDNRYQLELKTGVASW